jgi:enoyl-CoA hydratase/carnithine racemase
MLLTGELVPATDLASTGWIHRLVPESELEAAAMHVCRQLADTARPTQSSLKKLLHQIAGVPPATALQAELDTFAHNWTTQPVSAALEAFLSRTPAAVSP